MILTEIKNLKNEFAHQIIELHQQLLKRNENKISKNLLRFGTACIIEQSLINTRNKRKINRNLKACIKEIEITIYWLQLLKKAEYITFTEYSELFLKAKSIIALLKKAISYKSAKELTY